MSSYQQTAVYKYLESLEHYLIGDIGVIRNICKEAESHEETNNLGHRIAISGVFLPLSHSSVETSKSTPFFRLTIPITLTLFSTLDYVGYLVGDNHNPLATNTNFLEFFKFAQKIGINVSADESEILNKVFRQGLTHVYFPKLSVGISYHSGNPAGKLYFKETNNCLILNLNRLEEIVLSVLRYVLMESALFISMETKYQNLLSKYQMDHSLQISNLKIS